MEHTKGRWRPALGLDREVNGHHAIAIECNSPEGPRVPAVVMGLEESPEIMANVQLIALAPTAPHECDPDCPGDLNRRKLEAYEKLLQFAEWATKPDGAYSRDMEVYFKNILDNVVDKAKELTNV